MSPSEGRRVIQASALFVGVLLLSLLMPYVAVAFHRLLPSLVANHLFFAPQNLFAFGQFVAPFRNGFDPAIPDGLVTPFVITVWCTAAVVFGLVTRRLKLRLALLSAPLAIFAVALAIHFLFGVFGYTMQLEGP